MQMSFRLLRFALVPAPVAVCALVSLAAHSTPTSGAQQIHFNRDIRPILSDNCFHCHGPDSGTRMAGLRLDQRDAAIAKGAIVPGNPQKSKLLDRVFASDHEMRMPPTSAHKELKPEQKALLRRWVAEGAIYEPHWAYVVPTRPALPTVQHRAWVRNPVDAFILARLENEHIAPSPQADKRTLLRRVTLDLTGLPPTPEEIRAFLSDTRPDAYERVVDKLLASPAYGERMAVPWLDMARYADTVGFHGDQYMNAWAYRDYVIDAFNQNKPFDRFTREQLAGDLLPDATPQQRTATCFNRLNMVTREGGAQSKEYLAKYTADRVRTVGMTWLGATVGCAECHDHKYDPIKQRDFYALGAFFADVQQWGVYADYGYTPEPDLRGYNNDSPFPPEMVVDSPYLKSRIARQKAAVLRVSEKIDAGFAAWQTSLRTFLAAHPDGWETPQPNIPATTMVAKNAAAVPTLPFVVEAGGAVTLSAASPATVEIVLKPQTNRVAALRLELLPYGATRSVFRPGIDGATLTLSVQVRRANGKTEPVTFRHAEANLCEPRYVGGEAMIGVQRGWKLSTTRKTERHVAVWLPESSLALGADDMVVLTLPSCPARSIRVSVSPLVTEWPDRTELAPAYLAAVQTTMPQAKRAYLLSAASDAARFAQAKRLESDILACRAGKTPVLVTRAVAPSVTRILPRGNWQDESGQVVLPATPSFLPGDTKGDGKRRLTRLDLANWLVSPQNPLTARVFVNRLWRQFFGNGISGQVEDLGAQGEWPTHPELLDWLAVEFRTGGKGWDVKRMVRLLVTSAAYRQASDLRPELQVKDPQNRLLASQNPRRLDAEFVRDNALAIAGLLNHDQGGPSVKPYQPAGYYANLQFPDRDYIASADERQYRRGVYSHRQRTFLHPMLAAFDAPSREDAVCTRTAANSPQQALTLLNDPSFVEAARVLAADILTTPSDDARLTRLYERVLARVPKPQERASLHAFLAQTRATYRAAPDDARKLLAVGSTPAPTNADPVELASWTNVCRVLLNLHETITRY